MAFPGLGLNLMGVGWSARTKEQDNLAKNAVNAGRITSLPGQLPDAGGTPLPKYSPFAAPDAPKPVEAPKPPAKPTPPDDIAGRKLIERQNTDGVTLRQSTGSPVGHYKGDQEIWTREEPPLVFPSDIASVTNVLPFIGFWARKGAIGERCIFLPIPPGISFSDNMQYSAIDLGIIGKAVARATTAAVNEGGAMTGAGGALGAAAGTFMNQMRSANGAAVASLAAKMTGFDNVSNFIDFGARQVVAPNTNTAFQNSTIRQFQFSFKMMPTDEKEAEQITEIVKRFRQNMYPMGNDLILTYPPIWNIYFYDGGVANENTKLPRIYDCYLIGMSAVYNSNGNMFHADGHPVETDIQLTFEETRALTLADIEDLSEGRKV